MGYMNSYYKLVDDIKTREDAVNKVKKTQSNSYEDSELCATDSLVIKKFEDGIEYHNNTVDGSFITAEDFATAYDYANTSTSVNNLHMSVKKTVTTSLQPTVSSVEDASKKAYRLVSEEFTTEMESVAGNISDCWDKAEIVKTDCSNLDNYDEKNSEHTLSYYENQLSADLKTARNYLESADKHLEIVEDILNNRGFKLAGVENVNLNTIPEMLAGDFSVFGENAETVESIFTKTGIDLTSEEGQALWMEINALINSDPENAASELKKIAENIPESWGYWESQGNWDSPADISYTADGCTSKSQFYEVDGVRLYLTRFEKDDSNTPILDTIMNKTSAYSGLDRIRSYPDVYKSALGNKSCIHLRFSTEDWNLNTIICSNSSPDIQMTGLDTKMAAIMYHNNDSLSESNETLVETLSEFNPQNSCYINFLDFVTQDLKNSDELKASIGQDNYNNIMQVIGKCVEESEKTYQAVVTTDSVTINQICSNGIVSPVLITTKDNNGQSVHFEDKIYGLDVSTHIGQKSNGSYGRVSETSYQDGIQVKSAFFSDNGNTECTLYYGSPESPQDKLVIPNTVKDSSGTSHKTAELTVTGGTVTVTYLGVDGKPLPEGQDYEKYWSDLGCDVSGTSDHFDEMEKKYNN